jgi:hypothetical protein
MPASQGSGGSDASREGDPHEPVVDAAHDGGDLAPESDSQQV